MSTTERKQTGSTMEQLREIRDKISVEIMNMSKEEIKAYFKKKKSVS